MKIAYIALDGKQFDSKKDCKEYEDKNSGVTFFNSDGVSIEFKHESCPSYILLPTVESVNYFKTKIDEWREESGYYNEYYRNDFRAPGIYIYAEGRHYYYYDRAEKDIAEKLLKEAGL